MIRSTDPTFSARSMVWTRSYSSATSPTFSDRIARTSSFSFAFAGPPPVAAFSASTTRGSLRVRVSTSRAKTTAAAGGPPMTDARDHSIATTSMSSRSVFANTTNAPPW